MDTYDVMEGVRTAIAVAGPGLGAVRLDSGDLGSLAAEVRALLDSLGATDTRIIVTSDLDEYAIAELASAPVDGYGVGTSLVTGSRRTRPLASSTRWSSAAGMPVAKRSPGKTSRGGRKSMSRRFSAGRRRRRGRGGARPAIAGGRAASPAARTAGTQAGSGSTTPSLAEARRRWVQSRDELPAEALQLSPGEPALPAGL